MRFPTAFWQTEDPGDFGFDLYSSQLYRKIGSFRCEVMYKVMHHPTKSYNPRKAEFVVMMKIDREIAFRISRITTYQTIQTLFNMKFYANGAVIEEFSNAISLEEIIQFDFSGRAITNYSRDHHHYFIARDVRITRSSSIV
jgi:hypothetical protein